MIGQSYAAGIRPAALYPSETDVLICDAGAEGRGEKMKHSTGPWRAQGNYIFSATYGAAIAQLYAVGAEEEAANARLIAAAPELLSALKSAAKWIESENEGNDDEPNICTRARAIIARIER